MANFIEAFNFCMAHEDENMSGAVTEDSGGKTRFGLASRFNPELEEQGYFTMPPEEAIEIAKKKYEDKYWLWGPVNDQKVANKLFDMGVNMGLTVTVRLLQKSLLECGFPVTQDAKLGPETFRQTNLCPAAALIPELKEQSRTYYLLIAESKPNLRQYLRGWLRRADA